MSKYQVQVLNLNSLSVVLFRTTYETREEAMLAGQNYVRDRQQENGDDLFYRVVFGDGEESREDIAGIVLNLIRNRVLDEDYEDEDEDEEDYCQGCLSDCETCPYDDEDYDEDDC